MTQKPNLQDAFLNALRKGKCGVSIHTINGYQINHAAILGYDNFVVLVETNGSQLMIYKHAISTIKPDKKIVGWHDGVEDDGE